MAKYEITGETRKWNGITLHRIRATRDFGEVSKGEVGGFIENEENLSHDGNCWVFGEAMVYGKATVFGKARVFEEARVSGEAMVFGEAMVYGKAIVYGDARVYGETIVSGEAMVFGEARVFGKARVFEEARVSGKARVSGEAAVFGKTRVSGVVTTNPISITGLTYDIIIYDDSMTIGCKAHSFEQWENFSDQEIISMDGKQALNFWRQYKEFLMSTCRQVR